MSTQMKAEVRSTKAVTWVRIRKKKPVISNTGKLFCFNNNVSNLYNNSVPTASNNKSDRPQVKIWDTWKTLKYLNINDSFHFERPWNKIWNTYFFKQIVDIFFYKAYYQESNILIIAYNSVVTIAEWLDGSFESQNRLWKALLNNTPSKAIVNAAYNITYRPLIEADDTGR
jgi:hypothetical protein